MRIRLLQVIVGCITIVNLGAQPVRTAAKASAFRVESTVVLVPTTVTDRKGSLVSGLRADSFQVTQDNTQQQIAYFGEQDLPASIGIVFDISGSMRRGLPKAKALLHTFLDASNPDDEAFLYTVSGKPALDSDFTSDLGTLPERLVFAEAGGSTALIDTVYAALLHNRSARNPRKAMLIISDGMDNHSRYSRRELTEAVLEADLQIYSITVFDPPLTKKPIELKEEHDGIVLLEELTRLSGGAQVVVRNPAEMQRAAGDIARVIRAQYLIGYVPRPDGLKGKQWHSLKVRMNLAGKIAFARSGFFSR